MSGYKCSLELNLELVSSPGTHLPNRDLLYVVVEAFGQAKRTRLLDAVFPLCIHERFRFERCFWTAEDPRQVADLMAEAVVTVELRQVTDVYLGGCLLAYLKTDACSFFQPPTTGGSFRSGDRMLTLNRTVDFPGPGPRLEFDTRAVIEELPGGVGSGSGGSGGLRLLSGDGNSRRPRPPQPTSSSSANGGFDRQTVAAALRTSKTPPPRPQSRARSRSPSPSRYRPPFVVRHVDDSLVGRKPTLHDNFPAGSAAGADGRRSRQRLRSTSPSPLTSSVKRRSRSAAEGLDDSGIGGDVGASGGRRRTPSASSPTRGKADSLTSRYPSLSALPYRPYYPYYYDPYYYQYYPYYYWYPYYRRYRYPYYADDLDLLEMDLRMARLRRLGVY